MNFGHKYASRASRMKASEIRELLKIMDKLDVISFAGGIPDADLFPTQALQSASSWALTNTQSAQALQYSVSEGYAPLKNLDR